MRFLWQQEAVLATLRSWPWSHAQHPHALPWVVGLLSLSGEGLFPLCSCQLIWHGTEQHSGRKWGQDLSPASAGA